MNIRRIAIYAVNLHAGVAAIHGLAHYSIPVNNSLLAWVYILTVITAMPYVSLWVMRSNLRLGSSLLALCMLGALVFGFYSHFGAISPDHVHHLPVSGGFWAEIFQLTAALLVVTESLGVVVGLWGVQDEPIRSL